jgi:two-component system LytT family sensor kinase
MLELLLQQIGHRFPKRLFIIEPTTGWMWLTVIVATVLCVAIPIKIWNTARIEHRLAEQEQLLMRARVDALANQINPHFLFNTLTSISSLIRSQPETARTLIVKLSALLRRLLRSQEHFVTLREELAAIDEYLDIERIRFGPSLVIHKQVDEDTLDIVVPSMILQPLVENSIKHGLGRKVGEGHVTITANRRAGHAVIEIIDNGVGMAQEPLGTPGSGIGLRNVNERLRVIYGANYALQMHSVPGQGTSALIQIPELLVNERATA